MTVACPCPPCCSAPFPKFFDPFGESPGKAGIRTSEKQPVSNLRCPSGIAQ